MDTSTPGIKSGVLTISSNAPDEPLRLVTLIGEVIEDDCLGDVDGDGDIDLTDLSIMLGEIGLTGPGLASDLDGDEDVDLTDLSIMLGVFGQSC